MPKFRVTFTDEIEAASEEEAYEKMRDYLAQCCCFLGDITAFDFEEIVDESH